MDVANRVENADTTPCVTDVAVEMCRHLPRKYVVTQLRRKNFHELASSLPRARFTNDNVYAAVQEIADTVEEERGVQFDEMLFTMDIDNSNLEQTYDNIMYEMFRDTINWGKIITYIAFTAHVAVYCAGQSSLKSKVPDLVTWAEKVMEERLEDWIRSQGGTPAFLAHYGTPEWQVNLSSGVLAFGAVAAFATGLFALKQLFSS